MSQERFLQTLKAILVAALLGLVGLIDLVTGYEISVFPLYALPVGLAVRFFGVGVGMATAGAATLVWAWADVRAGHAYSKPWIVYLNATSRLVFFLLVALAVGYAVTILSRARSRLQNFSGTLPVCAGCSKIRDHRGYWWEMNGFLHEYGGAIIQSKLCPECAHEAYAAEEESAGPISR